MLFDIENIYNICVIEERVEDSRREINTVIEQRRNAGSKGIRNFHDSLETIRHGVTGHKYCM